MKDIWTEFSTWFLSNTNEVSREVVDQWRFNYGLLAKGLTYLLDPKIADGIREQLDQMGKEEEAESEKRANAAAQALAVSYAAAKKSTADATQQMQAQLTALVAQAAALPKPGVAGGGAIAAPDAGRIGQALGDAVRGAFAGGTTQRTFAFGDKVGVSAIVDSTAKTANATQSIDAKIKGGGLAFGA
jgi:hypothetical protein